MAIKNKKQKGVSLIITLFIMIIILAVVISISTLLYSEIKILRNVGNSVVGLYAADSGIEKVLYYDRQYKPSNGTSCISDADCSTPFTSCDEITKLCSKPVSRGLCSMFSSDDNPTNICSIGAGSVNCKSSTKVVGTINPDTGCDPNTCDDCTISFSTTLNSGTTQLNATNYTTTARVYTEGEVSKFEMSSKGDFSGASRQIQIVIDTEVASAPDPITGHGTPPSHPSIDSAIATCVVPKKIEVIVSDPDNDVDSVVAHVLDASENITDIILEAQGTGTWSKAWHPIDGETYYLSITATDDIGNSTNQNFGTICL